MKQYVRALGRAADRLAACRDPSSVAHMAAGLIVSDFPAHAALVWLKRDGLGGFRLECQRAAIPAADEAPLSDSDPLWGLVEQAGHTGAPVVQSLRQDRTDLQLSPWWRGTTLTAVVIPLSVEENVAGVVAALCDEVLSDETIGALLALSKVVAMALDRARLAEAREDATPQEDQDEGVSVDIGDVVGHVLTTVEDLGPESLGREEARLRAVQREARARVKAAEERAKVLARLAAEREAVLHQMVEGVVLADAEGRITFINDAGRRILGVGQAGMTLTEYATAFQVLTPDGRSVPWEERSLARAIQRKESSLNQEKRVRRADGTEVVTESSAVPVLDADGALLGAVLTFRDVTEQRNLDRQKDDFLSAVAHDLKAPLTTIKGYTQLLQLRAGAAETISASQVTEGLARVDAVASRMAGYVDELLDVIRMQMGRELELVRRPVDLVALVRDVAAERQETTSRHTLEVVTTLPSIVGIWDAHRLERVLTNLFTNSIKYSPAGGTISIKLQADDAPDGRWAVLTVSDEGIGIPPSDLPYIFDRFHRGQNVPRQIPGTGIGLTAVRQIVEQQGGTVSASSAEGRGASFTIRLPVAASLDEAGLPVLLREPG